MQSATLPRIALPIAFLLLFSLGCERTPESLEEWRTAEGGYEKMAEWATSPEESEAVRIRAVQILIEEHQTSRLAPLMEAIEDEALRAKLVQGAVPTVEKMWATADWPKIDASAAGATGRVKVEGRSRSVTAKDAAYQLEPFAKAESREKLQNILAQWMSADQDIRDQLGQTTLAQIAPRAGAQGVPMMLEWLRVTKKPAVVVEKIIAANADEKNEEVAEALAREIARRAEAEHPELAEQTRLSLLRMTHPAVAPYLERAITDPQSPPQLIDEAMIVYQRVMGERATPLFARLVTERDGNMRWVAAMRLVELRGKAGVLTAAKALPLEGDSYVVPTPDAFEEETTKFCRMGLQELEKQDIDSPNDTIRSLLQSERWPARVLGIRCAELADDEALAPDLEAIANERQTIHGWGEKQTVGQFASEVARSLGT